jgi:hypothetical protein
MSIAVICQCGKKFQAKDEHAGLKTKCPSCGLPLIIPPAAERPAAVRAGTPTALTASTPAPAIPAPAAPASAALAPAAPPSYEGRRVADWLDLLQVDDPAARKHAAQVLANIGPEAETELSVFIQRLEAEHVLLRHWAVTCLERIGPAARGAVEALLARLDDEEPLIRGKVATALESIEPDCAPFVARLRRGLVHKDAEHRAAAIGTFRREMKTLGISRCRFWSCACGCVYEKENLDDRLKLLADGAPVDWQGARVCKKCGKSHALNDVYAGKHDVPQKFWPQVVKRFGDRVQVPDDLLVDKSQQPQGYDLSESQMLDTLAILPGGPSAMPVFSDSVDEGYALAEALPVHQAPIETRAENDNEFVPGAVVPQTGHYNCKSCHKARLASDKSSQIAVKQKTVLKHFKAGKTFAECPNCGDLTEWQRIKG